MADPPTPTGTTPTPPSTPANQPTPVLPQLSTEQLIKAALASKDLNTIIQTLTGSLKETFKATEDWVKSLADSNAVQAVVKESTVHNIDAIGLITTEVLGATKAFDGFTAHIGKISLFSDQIDDFKSSFGFLGTTIEAVGKKMGGTDAVFNAAGGVENWIKKVAQSADGAIKLQQEYVGIAGATGNMTAMFAAAGDHLQNLNDMMLKHGANINEIASATGTTSSIVAPIWDKLGHLYKGASDELVSGGQKGGAAMNQTEAAMKLASGTGRDQMEVVSDLKTAWESFGLSGDKALEFTERMSDLSNKLGINLDYTRQFIVDNANAFKMLSDGGTDAVNTFNRLEPALQATGLSAKTASELVGTITNRMSNLTIAQEAFLSAQTGGPGGLRGALKVENLMREGKTDEVFDMAMQSLKKNFGGKIYTQKEAETSEFAAAQFVKQRQMLQSGAFGALAPDKDTATRLLEAMGKGIGLKDMKQTDALGNVKDTLGKSVSDGAKLQQTTNNMLSVATRSAEYLRSIDANTNLRGIQNTVGTGEGSAFADALADGARMATERSAELTGNIHREMAGKGSATDNLKANDLRFEQLKTVVSTLEDSLPESAKAMIGNMMDVIGKGAPGEDKALQIAQNDLARAKAENADIYRRTQASGGKISEADQAILDKNKVMLNAANEFKTNFTRTMGHELGVPGAAPYVNTGRSVGVGQAALSAARGQPLVPPTGKGKAGEAPYEKNKVHVDVKMHGVICSSCAKPITPSPQTTITTMGAGST
jgi:hypothetical protein